MEFERCISRRNTASCASHVRSRPSRSTNCDDTSCPETERESIVPRRARASLVASKFSLGTRIRSVPDRDSSPCDWEEDSTYPWNVPAIVVAWSKLLLKSSLPTCTESCAVLTISGPTAGTGAVSKLVVPPESETLSGAACAGAAVAGTGGPAATPSEAPEVAELIDTEFEPTPPPVTRYPTPAPSPSTATMAISARFIRTLLRSVSRLDEGRGRGGSRSPRVVQRARLTRAAGTPAS